MQYNLRRENWKPATLWLTVSRKMVLKPVNVDSTSVYGYYRFSPSFMANAAMGSILSHTTDGAVL